MKTGYLAGVAMVVGTVSLIPGVALAQVSDQAVTVPEEGQVSAQAQPPEPAPPEDGGVGDIIVTAQRSSQRLQDVPLAVTALSADTLAAAGVKNTLDLPALTPGLVLTTNQTGVQVYLRGIGGVGSAVGIEGSVATYVDGVYISALSATAMNYNNIERVEVLRGPQGTLFGRNTTGGLIQIITREPGRAAEFEGGFSYGNYDTVESRLYAATPLSSTLAADIAFYGIKQNDGFGQVVTTTPSAPNPNVGTDVNRRRSWSARSKWVWTPFDSAKFTLIGDYTNDHTDFGIVRRERIGSLQVGGRITDGGPWDTGAGQVPMAHIRQGGASLRFEYDFGDINLTSITAYRRSVLDNVLDQDSGPVRVFTGIQHEENDSFQQELLVQGGAGRLSWTVGAFYFWQDGVQSPQHRTSDTTTAVNFNHYSSQIVRAYSGYAQGTYAITDETNLTLGARITTEKHTLSGRQVLDSPPNPAATVINYPTRSNTDTEPSFRAVLDHHFTPEIMAYVAYDRGFKSGSFNNSGLADPPTEPEILTAYQGGVKTQFWDRQVRLNVAGYIYRYSNIQLQSIPFGVSLLFNAAEARSHGVEADLVVAPRLPTGRFEIGTNVAYQQGEYTRFPAGVGTELNPAGGGIVYSADFSGKSMTRLPKWTVSTNLNYSLPIGPNEARFGATWLYNDGFFFESDNRVRQSPFHMVNGEISFGPEDSRWRLRVFAANLFNEVVLAQISAGAVGDQASYAPPRTYGVGMNFRF